MKLGAIAEFARRVTPLRIAMLIGLLFATVHFVIEIEVFEYGPLSTKGIIRLLDLKALDVKFLNRNTKDLPEPKVVIAAIDERSIEKYGLWPWNRHVIADLTRTASKGGAKVIAFDMVFGDEDRNSSYVSIKRFLDAYGEKALAPASTQNVSLATEVQSADKLQAETRVVLSELEKGLRERGGPARAQLLEVLAKARRANERGTKSVQKARGLLSDWSTRAASYEELLTREVTSVSPDDDLARALAESPEVIQGYFGFASESELAGLDIKKLAAEMNNLSPAAIPHIYEHVTQDLGGAIIEKHEPVEDLDFEELQIGRMVYGRTPLAMLAKGGKHFGFFNIYLDQDGTIRRARMLFKYGDKLFPALSLAAAARYFGTDIYPLNGQIKPGVTIDSINLGDQRNIPTDGHGRLLLNYYAPPEKYFPVFSISQIISGEVPPEKYKDKVMLVAATAIGTFDIRPTPFGALPGVYTHATLVQNILDGRFLERYEGVALMEILGYLLLALLMGLLLPRLPAWAGIVGTLGFSVGLYFVDVTLVFPKGTWMLNVLPTLQAFFTFAGIVVYKYLTEGREKKKIRQAFQFYLTKSVVDEVLKDPTKLKLGGQRMNCTVMFSDVRGFTTLSETLTPEQLSDTLNAYLTPMTNLVFKYDGTLDKYIGDAIMAIFGAPINFPDHPTRACYCCLDMMDQLAALKAKWKAENFPGQNIDIGIGLNTGPMSVGNMGSDMRFDYTVMGDMVNLASRLEAINKEYGTNIIISEFTYAAAKNDIYVREMDLVKVKGKNEPVRIYELLGRGKAPPAIEALNKVWDAAFVAYRAGRWDEAKALFTKVKDELRPGDGPAETYIERCELLKADPPEEWIGVWTMKTK